MSSAFKPRTNPRYRAPDILLPIGRKIPVVMNERKVPLGMQGQVSGAIRDPRQVSEIKHVFGADTKPEAPLMLYGPRGEAIMLVGGGDTEASELQDIAAEALERANERAQNPTAYFDKMRERAGMARREDVPKMMRDAIEERIERHRRNPVTDPFRVPAPPPAGAPE